ncbi:carboxyl-terminal processing protease CtpA [Almyronema epifaneia]|uniref:Carboxyl-terminal processing protease CtpA n=1 Tax=Almyronema epifaneia S1 TaxID=2991925 RepID=A0ABW6IIX1_9CYAN
MRNSFLKSLLGLLLVLVLWLGLQPSTALAVSSEQRFVSEVWRIVSRAYLDETFNHQNWWLTRQRFLKQPMPDRAAAYQAAQEMLASLEDPYTRLLQPDQYRSLQTSTSGELTGVGLQITRDAEQKFLKVIAPIEGSPAAKADVQPRDRILAINGISTDTFTLDEAASQMRGPIGSQVNLRIGREEREFDITLVRDRITLNPVYADLRIQPDGKRIGYLRLSQFNANAADEIREAILLLEEQNAAGYILDLRNNPGGLLQAGIEITRLWLDQGTIVYTVNRQGILDSITAHGPALTDDPLVVLVNQGTASASEILAGALKDNGRAVLIGDVTFGKGLIQSLFDLSDGSGLAVTVAKYETPNHSDINKLGIQPNYKVPLEPIAREQVATAADTQYQAAIDILCASNTVLAEAP